MDLVNPYRLLRETESAPGESGCNGPREFHARSFQRGRSTSSLASLSSGVNRLTEKDANHLPLKTGFQHLFRYFEYLECVFAHLHGICFHPPLLSSKHQKSSSQGVCLRVRGPGISARPFLQEFRVPKTWRRIFFSGAPNNKTPHFWGFPKKETPKRQIWPPDAIPGPSERAGRPAPCAMASVPHAAGCLAFRLADGFARNALFANQIILFQRRDESRSPESGIVVFLCWGAGEKRKTS